MVRPFFAGVMSMIAGTDVMGRMKRFALFVLFFAFLFVLETAATYGGDVHYELTFQDGTPGYDLNADAKGSNALKNAIDAITANVLNGGNPAADYKAQVKINIMADDTALITDGNVYQSAYHLYGGTDKNGYTANKGHYSVEIDGTKTGGGRSTLSGNNTFSLLRVVHVADHISVSNLILERGAFTDLGGNTVNEAFGAGLMLGVGGGLDGLGTGRTPGTITVENVTAQNNKINITGATAGGTSNAYGAGIFVLGVNSNAGSPDYSQPGSDVIFRNVDLTSNKIDFANVSGSSSVRGGGARIAYSKSFTYQGGTVSDNQITASKIEHASGGGLSVDGAGFDGPVAIAGVMFDSNTVTITDPGAQDNWGVARGGGFYSYVRPDPITPNKMLDISFGKNGNTNTVFKDNKVLAQRGGGGTGPVSAWGGGAYIYINQTNANFAGTEFTGNEAESKSGEGGGGAIAIDLYTGGTANGKLTVTGATFTDNKAIGTTAAYGGAIYARTGTGSGHALTGNTYTSNRARASAATGVAYGGAVAFMSGSHTLKGETFESNVASGGAAAYGGAAYFAEGTNKILSSTFKTNSAVGGDGYGGALSFGATATGTEITDSLFEGNFVDAATDQDGKGGAVYFAGGQHTITGGSFKANYVTSLGYASQTLSGGAAYFGGTGGNTVSGASFQNNYIEANVYQDGAGGALYFQGGGVANTVDKTLISGNKIDAGRQGSGGGIYVEGGDFTLSNSVVDRNTVKAGISVSGGGITYGGNGTLTVANSSITRNVLTYGATGQYAGGSAIHVRVQAAGGSTLNLTADKGKTTDISGNSVNGFSNENGISFLFAGATSPNREAELNVKGEGTVKVDNGITTFYDGTFTLTKTDTGRFEWNGTNDFNVGAYAGPGTATIDLQKGDVHLGATFTAKATGNTNFHVSISKNVNLTFDPTRDSTLAMFDFSKNTSPDVDSDKMVVGDATGKVGIAAGLGRSVYSSSKEYTLVSGIADPSQLKEIMNGFEYKSAYSYNQSGKIYIDDNKVKVGYNYVSPFDSNGPNAKSAQGAMNELLSIQPPISDAEWQGVLDNARAAYPELFMDQARIVMDAVDFMSRTAVDYGLRSPHRTRMITEFGYMPQVVQGETLTPYDDYGDPVRQGYIYNDGASYDSYSAYPNAVLEKCGTLLPSPKGFRLWAGYAGNWQEMDSHAGLNGYKVDRNGFLIGLNYDFGPVASVGAYGGYSSSTSTAKRITSTVDSDAGHFGVIGRLSPLANYREFSVYADLGYHFANNDFSRQLGRWGASGEFDQTIVTIGLGAEHIFRLGALNLIPHAEARFIDLDQDHMNEHGSSITTTRVDGVNKKGFNMRMGVEMSRDYFLTRGVVSPTFNFAWRHEFSNHSYVSDAYYLQSPTPHTFNVQSSRIDRDSVDVGLALRTLRAVGNSSTLGVNVGYNMNLSRNSSTHSLYAGCEIGF